MEINFLRFFTRRVSAAPLAVFRIIFGSVMLLAVIRFWVNGWIDTQYLRPTFFFSYWGLDWVRPYGSYFMYSLFTLLGLSCLGILLGAWYRVSAILFTLAFTYVELIDKTNYLNHYYFISLAGFLLCLLPAHHQFSVDSLRRNNTAKPFNPLVPRWTIITIQLQLGLVYFFAGLAKLQPDWLFEALPLKIWLPANGHLPIIGHFLDQLWVAYAFSWIGAIYDLTIPFWLLWARTRLFGFATVVIFHTLTAILFPIGMFPFIMIGASLIFFPQSFHQNLLNKLRYAGTFIFKSSLKSSEKKQNLTSPELSKGTGKRIIPALLLVYFLFQILLPLRFLVLPGDLFWHENGFRFSWRVMLMEKAGYAEFTVRDAQGKSTLIENCDFLTPNQEKMMSTQPDMILQFAHYLGEHYESRGWEEPQVYAYSYVTLNGCGSQIFVRPDIDLVKIASSQNRTQWIAPRVEAY